MQIKEISNPKLCLPKGVYSQATEVTGQSRLVFVSGFTSRDAMGNVVGKGDIRLQTETVLRNIQTLLEDLGGSLGNIVKLTVYIRDMNMFVEIHEVRAKYFSHPYPACSMLEVSRLVDPDHLIEIEAIAVF